MPLLGGQRLDKEESATFDFTEIHYGHFTNMFYAVCPRLLKSVCVVLLLLYDCSGGESDRDTIAGSCNVQHTSYSICFSINSTSSAI